MPETEFNEFLDVFDVIQGNIYEMLITTSSETGVLNTAPFGVKFTGKDDSIYVKAYEGTTTLLNLKSTCSCIISIVHDPILFFIALRKGKIDHYSSSQAKSGEIIYSDTAFKHLRPLKGSQGYVIAEVNRIVSDKNPNEIYLKVIKAFSLGNNTIFCRARAALVEMMIYLSRMNILDEQKTRNGIISTLNDLLIIVEKTGCDSWVNLANEIIWIAERFQESD